MEAKLLNKKSKTGMQVKRKFTTTGKDPLTLVEYDKRNSAITEPGGKVVFEMRDVEVPKTWSQLATDILVSKYFRKAGVPGKGHETSAKQVVYRIVHTLRTFGEEHNYFITKEDADAFEAELLHILINQIGAFNSPVWFNVGLYHQYGIKGSGGNYYFDYKTNSVEKAEDSYSHPQCSACFIQSINDDLMSIFELVKNEARLFKFGSGTGTNFSKVRSKFEKLSGGGTSSGLMSFLEVFDRGAGATKSGGTTRRAAKMVCLDMDHPEISEFIGWKAKEEKKAKILIAAGFPSDFNGEAYKTVGGQNSNNSVRISDEFMNSYLNGKKWYTKSRISGEIVGEFESRDLMQQIAQAAWECADPGVQFDTIINDWHTCSNTNRINASNPCSEYMFLDDTACNLASINLVKLLDQDGNFDVEGFKHAAKLFIIAQEIAVDLASYPTESIAKNSHVYRTLGLGYANLGTLLMVSGVPYDSEKGRSIAAAITAIMTGQAYKTSAELASTLGPFEDYAKNRESMLRVMNKHRDAAYKIDVKTCPSYLLEAARESWDNAVSNGEKFGYRNAQTTVLAPTGTIGLLMDCDTTGIEPDFSIVKWKKLAGGGYFKIINQSIPRALQKLGYTEDEMLDMITYILGRGSLEGAPHVNLEALLKLGYTKDEIQAANDYIQNTKGWDDWTPNVNPKDLKKKGLSSKQIQEAMVYITGSQMMESAPHLKDEHIAIFDCANKCGMGVRFIDPMGHVKMMAAVQPFISGAISKTVNLPNNATVDDIKNIYVEGWKMGLKAIALYRDGCKSSQPLNTTSDSKEDTKSDSKITAVAVGDKKLEKPIAVVERPIDLFPRGTRKPLPQERKGITVESRIGGHKVFVRTGEYSEGVLGEIFIDMHKEGAAFRSMMNCFAIAVSIGLQHGVPLQKYVDTFTFTRFEPNGMTNHPNIRTCTSVVDFVFRYLGMKYLGRTDFVHVKPVDPTPIEISGLNGNGGLNGHDNSHVVPQDSSVQQPLGAFEQGAAERVESNATTNLMDKQLSEMMGDAPPCSECGHITIRNGSCYKCLNCGTSQGCS